MTEHDTRQRKVPVPEQGIRSCQHCKHGVEHNSNEYPFKCMISKPIPMMVHRYCVNWFGYVGCHSFEVKP